jgi:hypothetical protein
MGSGGGRRRITKLEAKRPRARKVRKWEGGRVARYEG